LETPKFRLVDILYAIIIPLAVALAIYLLAIFVNPSGSHHIFGAGSVISVILTQGFAQMIVLGVPMALGLLWNRWAGGAAGFIMGGMYYVASAGLYTSYYASQSYNFFGDISMMGWMINAVILGYMVGALTNGSTGFKRMLGAGLTSALIIATIQAYLNYTVALKPSRNMAISEWASKSYLGVPGLEGFTLSFVPSIALGVVVPIIAKVMTWYGLQPMRHQ
jgi:predicted anti-sigma-YlaC factor YlaD